MIDILQRIVAVKREEVAAAQAACPLPALRAQAQARRGDLRDFAGALRQRVAAGPLAPVDDALSAFGRSLTEYEAVVGGAR